MSAPSLTVALTPREAAEGTLRGAAVAVIDVLRATSTIPRALAEGASRVIPVATVEQATSLHASLDRDHALLCGEREGKRIEGFHLGNSPAEYRREVVEGRPLVFCSTNGSGALVRCLPAAGVVAASFVNATLALEWLAGRTEPPVIVCSGKLGRACLEDTVMAGLLAEGLLERCGGPVPDDGARMAVELWRRWREDLHGMLRASEHGAYLEELGFAGDLALCSARDSVPVLPRLRDGVLVAGEPGPVQSPQASR